MIDLMEPEATEPLEPRPAKRRSRAGRAISAIVVGLALAGGGAFVFHTYGSASSAPAAAAPPPDPVPIPVSATYATVRDLPIERSGLGTVTPENQVDIKVRIDGQLQRLAFREGQEVKAGDLLAEIDPRPYQAVLAQAEAALQRDAAQLNNAEADEARAVKLTASGAGTSQAADAARLQVAVYKAAMAGDQAAVDTAKLNLDYATIRAPISGRVGLKQVDEGALLHTNDPTGIVTITQMQPISVKFSMPQDELSLLLTGQAQAPLDVSVETRDRSKHLADGKLAVIDNQIDTSTGMVKLKAEFDNSDQALWPGQLVTARILLKTERNAVVVSSIAVQNGQKGPYLFVVKPDDTVAIVQVQTGPTVGDMTAIPSGIAPGDNIVVSGQSRLTEGSRVAVTQVDATSQHIAFETP